MTRKLLHIAAMAILAVAFSAIPLRAHAENKAPQWETVSSDDSSDSMHDELQRENVTISSRDGAIYISVAKPVKIEIYSILGQLITSKQIKPGTVRLSLNRRGVYILKAGTITRRINL